MVVWAYILIVLNFSKMISIIIPAYNVEKYIAETIFYHIFTDSILSIKWIIQYNG